MNHALTFLSGGYDRPELQAKKQLRLIAARIAKPQTQRITLEPDWYLEGYAKAPAKKAPPAPSEFPKSRFGCMVYYSATRGKWLAKIKSSGNWKVIGHYDTEQDAIDARTSALDGKGRARWLKRVAESQ